MRIDIYCKLVHKKNWVLKHARGSVAYQVGPLPIDMLQYTYLSGLPGIVKMYRALSKCPHG